MGFINISIPSKVNALGNRRRCSVSIVNINRSLNRLIQIVFGNAIRIIFSWIIWKLVDSGFGLICRNYDMRWLDFNSLIICFSTLKRNLFRCWLLAIS